MKKFSAFTLAETLIVIGLIGVVSALTLPNLTKSTNDMEVVSKVKKEHSVLSEAYARARTKYGTKLKSWYNASDTTVPAKSTRVAKRLIEYMNVSEDCGLNNTTCFPASAVTISGGTSETLNDENSYSFISNDGASFVLKCHAALSGCDVYIDVDGPSKGFNTIGKDIFKFTIAANPVNNRAPVGTAALTATDIAATDCSTGATLVCTKHVLENGNTEY